MDLKRKKFVRHCFSSLVDCVGRALNWGDMVVQGNTVYLIGGTVPPLDLDHWMKMLQINAESPLSHNPEFHIGASLLEFNTRDLSAITTTGTGKKKSEWVPMPAPPGDPWFVQCTSYDGRVYNFGYLIPTKQSNPPINTELLSKEYEDGDEQLHRLRFLCTPKVFSHGRWEPLETPPKFLVGSRLSYPLLPDPRNKRIVMHLSHGNLPQPCLYAFVPRSSEWICLNDNFPDWTATAALVDGVIYFQRPSVPSLLEAYDMASKQPLDVKWSRPPPVVQGVDFTKEQLDCCFCWTMTTSASSCNHFWNCISCSGNLLTPPFYSLSSVFCAAMVVQPFLPLPPPNMYYFLALAKCAILLLFSRE